MYHLIEPDLGRISGGLRYNWALVEAAGGRLQRHALPGAWPDPSTEDVELLQQFIARLEQPLLIDGLIGCYVPEPLRADVPVVQLIHALATTPQAQQLERRALNSAAAVIATSRFSAEALRARHDIEVTAAVPGAGFRPLATGGAGGNFLCVGAIEPNKNQGFLLEALTELAQRGMHGWQCRFIGPVNDTAYAETLRAVAEELPAGKVEFTGEVKDAELAHHYDWADLLLLSSHAETFGLVVQEASAAGVPALVTKGTGAEEALGAGNALPLEVPAWVDQLSHWLTDHEHREKTRAAARAARRHLAYGWEATAQIILAVLDQVSAQ